MNFGTLRGAKLGAYDGIASWPPGFEDTVTYRCPLTARRPRNSASARVGKKARKAGVEVVFKNAVAEALPFPDTQIRRCNDYRCFFSAFLCPIGSDADEIRSYRSNYASGQSSNCCGFSASECFPVMSRRCLLISGSKVRVLDGPPNLSGASVAAGAPDLLLVLNWCPRFAVRVPLFGALGPARPSTKRSSARTTGAS